MSKFDNDEERWAALVFIGFILTWHIGVAILLYLAQNSGDEPQYETSAVVCEAAKQGTLTAGSGLMVTQTLSRNGCHWTGGSTEKSASVAVQ